MAFRLETESDHILLTLDRPPVNTLDLDAVTALREAFHAHPDDTPLILTGAGKAFCAGVDTKAFMAYDGRERAALFDAITAMAALLVSIRAPVIAAINGHALGGGLVLSLCADYRLAAEGPHKFGLTEAAAGVPFPAGPVEIIRHEVPAALLRQLTLSSRVVSAQDLARHSVIDEILPADRLLTEATDRAEQLASQPAFSQVKAQMRGQLAQRLTELAKV
ncbi:MAG: enoyl-CoA hydratase/isomerase family protein [Hyphomonadaceae bacterium]|nr:enoyl-CoA hydratase/isomerase family protein [Hyphomonadaceae bacterium]